MNLKAIDAAIAAYRTNLDESDVSRLAFFRELWGFRPRRPPMLISATKCPTPIA